MRKLLFKFLESRLEKWFREKTKNGNLIPVVFFYSETGDKEPAIIISKNNGEPENLLVFSTNDTYIMTDVVHSDFKKEGFSYWDNN